MSLAQDAANIVRSGPQSCPTAPVRRSQRLLDMGRSPRRTSAHISPTSPQAHEPGGILDNQAMGQVPRRGPSHSPPRHSQDRGDIPENHCNMEAGPSRPAPPDFPPPVVEDDVSSTNSQHAPVRGHNPVEPSLLDALDSLLHYREKQRTYMESRPVPTRQELPHLQELPPQHQLPPPPPLVGGPAGMTMTPDMMAALENLLAWKQNLRLNEPSRACVRGADHRAPAVQAPPAPNVQAHPEPILNTGRAPTTPTLEQIEQLINARMGQSKVKVMPALLDSASHPFHPDLAGIIIPPSIVPRAIPDYVGKGDPVQHVRRHETSLLGKTVEGSYHALTFPATLGGNAATWFFNLPKESVTSWSDLKMKFIQHFLGERQLLKGSGSLDDVKQEPNESLAGFYSRFNRNIADIDEELSQGEVVRAFLRNLTAPYGTPLKDSSEVKRIYTIEKLAERVKMFIDLENSRIRRGELPSPEKLRLKKRSGASSGEQKTQNKPQPTSDAAAFLGRGVGERNFGRRPETFGRRPETFGRRPESNYTALVCSISELYKEIAKYDLIEPPPYKGKKVRMGMNPDQWCEYHEVEGHSTDNCHDLKEAIEAMIRKGALKKFVASKRPRSRSPPPRKRMSYGSAKKPEYRPETLLPPGPIKYIE